jgi:hypothetical protein
MASKDLPSLVANAAVRYAHYMRRAHRAQGTAEAQELDADCRAVVEACGDVRTALLEMSEPAAATRALIQYIDSFAAYDPASRVRLPVSFSNTLSSELKALASSCKELLGETPSAERTRVLCVLAALTQDVSDTRLGELGQVSEALAGDVRRAWEETITSRGALKVYLNNCEVVSRMGLSATEGRAIIDGLPGPVTGPISPPTWLKSPEAPRIMPLGASFTEGHPSTRGGYRLDLFARFVADGLPMQFVG